MADDTGGLASVLGERLDVRDEVIRLGVMMKQVATREEVNEGDNRTERNVSVIIDRSASALQGYVRDRVNESSLKTENSLKDVEKHLKEYYATALSAAIAPLMAQMAQANEMGQRRGGGFNHFFGYGATGILMSGVWLIAYALGFRPPGL